LNSVESVNTIQRISTPTFAAAFSRTISLGDGVMKKIKAFNFRKPQQITFD